MTTPHTELTKQSILAARQWFHDNCLACAEGAITKKWFCNNPEEYAERQRQKAKEFLQGKCDNTFTFWQKAYYIQTGDCVALLPK